jgi:hypothetical protein
MRTDVWTGWVVVKAWSEGTRYFSPLLRVLDVFALGPRQNRFFPSTLAASK